MGQWLIVLAYGLVLVSFILTNPLGAASDEPAHFYKAAALAHGQLRGEPATITTQVGWSSTMLDWVSRTSREFRLRPGEDGCDAFNLPAPACPQQRSGTQPLLTPGHQVSYVGTYPPLPYFAPAVGIRLAEVTGAGLDGTVRAARLAGGALNFALLLLAARLLVHGRRDVTATVGLVLCLTPIVTFTVAQVAGSGLEIASALCFVSASLRLADAGERAAPVPGWVWAATATSGLLFASSRSTAPLWCVLVLVLICLARPRAMVAAVLRGGRRAQATGAVLAVGVLATVWWELAFEPRVSASPAQVLTNLPVAWQRLSEVADQTIGRLGWISIRLDGQLIALWWALLLLLLFAAALVGSWWDRLALLTACVSVIALVLAVDAAVVQPTSKDFQMQARYVYGVAVVVPLLAADTLRRRRLPGLPAGAAPTLVAVLIALTLQLAATAFMVNLNAYRFTPGSAVPHLGWSAWRLVLAMAVLMGVVGGVTLASAEDDTTVASPAAVDSAGALHPEQPSVEVEVRSG